MKCRLLRRSIFGLALGCAIAAARPASAQTFLQTNLVTDDQTVNAAKLADTDLKNPWGVSFSPTGSPFWVSDNGTGLSTLYNVNGTTDAVAKVSALRVVIPGDGTPTGQAFGGGVGFNGDLFLFASEDGTISGWRGALGSNAEVLQIASAANVYKGLTFANISGNSYLYAANFKTGAIDVLKGNAANPNLTGTFTDPTLPAGFAPFNVQRIGNTIYVAYAKQGVGKDEDAGPGLGFVSAFDLQGSFLGRIGSQGTLNAPWGLAIAPSTFGAFAGDLLVGNFGDGTINAFDLGTDTFVGQLLAPGGAPVTIDGLWTLTPGSGLGGGGSSGKLYFTAGPNDEANGLFGALVAVPEPGPLALIGAAFVPTALLLRRRKR